MAKRKHILIIYTGGTIGMIDQPVTGALVPVDFSEIETQIPELRKFDLTLETYTFDPIIDSSNVSPEFWIDLAKLIEEYYDQVDGVVILHGTDTMAFTASALSFMLENLQKPVILTGSQLPVGVLRTDGKENLLSAIEIAADYRDDTPMVAEVCIFFQNQLFRGNRTTKHNAEYFNAFVSENYPPLAETGIHIHYHTSPYNAPDNHITLKVHTGLNPHVGILKIFPGITPELVKALLETVGLKGLVLETFGSGNAPTSEWFIDLLENAIRSGLIILNVSQCPAGSVLPGKYETSRQLQNIGVLNGRDMTTEAALTKMMFLLGQDIEASEVKVLMNRAIRGEITL